MLAIRLESRGHPISGSAESARNGKPFDMFKLRTMVDGAEHIGAGLAINENDSRVTRVGAILRRSSLDELPNLVNVVRGDMSLIGPRPTIPIQVAQYTPRQRGRLAIRPGITGWAQVNGRAALPWSERIELDLYYIEHRSLALDLRILGRTLAIVFGGSGLYKGQTGGWEEREMDEPRDRFAGFLRFESRRATPAIMLTGVGKRYDIVSCFAALTRVVAVDPNPLAPARYAAQVRVSAPPIEDPAYVPELARLCQLHDVGLVLPLTDLDIETLARASEVGLLPALVPSSEVARATYDKYEAHLLLESWLALAPHGAARRRSRRDRVSGDGQAPPRVRRTLDPPCPRSRASPLLRRYVPEPTMVQRAMGGPELSIDCLGDLTGNCLNAIPRSMFESRGGESIKGTVVEAPDLVELGRRDDGGLARAGTRHDPGFPRSRFGRAHHRREHPLRRRLPRTRLGGLAQTLLSGADRAHGRQREHSCARRRVPPRSYIHALLLAAGAGLRAAPHRA